MTVILTEVKHLHQTSIPDDPDYDVSAGEWNQGHNVVVGVPSSIGATNVEGVSAELCRKDHVHAHPSGLGADLHHTKYTDAEAIAAVEGESDLDLSGVVGIGGAAVATSLLKILTAGTETYGIQMDLNTNPYTGTSPNYGVNVLKRISSGGSSGGFLSGALDFSITNLRDVQNSFFGSHMLSLGIRGYVYDSGSLTGTSGFTGRQTTGMFAGAIWNGAETSSGGSNQYILRGVVSQTSFAGTINNASASLSAQIKGIDIDVDSTPTITAGGLSQSVYGVYCDVNVNPSTDSGIHNVYGAYFLVRGTTEGTSIIYGVYVDVAGADTNWAGYFTGGPSLFTDKVCFTQTDKNEYIDSLGDGYLDLEATTGIRLRINGNLELTLTDTLLQPETSNHIDLGDSEHQFKDFYLDGVAYIDTCKIEVGLNVEDIDVAATGVGSIAAVIPVTAGGTTLYIALYDSYS